MNRNRSHRLRSIAAVLSFGMVLSGCQQSGLDGIQGETFPAGAYPLELTAGALIPAVVMPRAATRGTVDNNWTGVASVAVQDNENEVVKEYAVTVDGNSGTVTLSADEDPLYWTGPNEEKQLTAWCPYSETFPEAWTVKADQSNLANYQAGDLVKGELTLSFADRNDPEKNKMTFHHQTAKMEVQLQAGVGVKLNEDVSVTLLNVTGVESGGTSVAPYRPDAESYKYLALLNGQTIDAGTPFIQVTLGDNTFHYTPKSNLELLAGTAYVYTITVNANGIEVEGVSVGSWTDGGSENVLTYKTDLSTAKVGDLITKSGKLIDVDDLDLLTDEARQQVAGVVFWTPSETNADGRTTPASLTDDKIMAADHPDCTHGLAVSVKTVIYEDPKGYVEWQEPYESVATWQAGQGQFAPGDATGYVSLVSDENATANINKIYGYQNSVVLRAYNEYCLKNDKSDYIVKPLVAIDNYGLVNPAPEGSTGWFLPSVKELHMLCYKDVDDVNVNYGVETLILVNASLVSAGGDELEGFYHSSTECNKAYDIFELAFTSGKLTDMFKKYRRYTLAVCAF